jgi:hypothetical protein
MLSRHRNPEVSIRRSSRPDSGDARSAGNRPFRRTRSPALDHRGRTLWSGIAELEDTAAPDSRGPILDVSRSDSSNFSGT